MTAAGNDGSGGGGETLKHSHRIGFRRNSKVTLVRVRGSEVQRDRDSLLALANVPAILTLVTAISLALSVSRQLGFFFAIDLELMSLLSIDDIVRNSLAAVPFTLTFWALAILIAQSDYRPTSKILNAIFTFKQPRYELKLSVVAAVGYFLLSRNWPAYLLFQLTIAYGALLTLIYDSHGRLSRLPVDVFYGGFLIINAFLLGASEGKNALIKPDLDFTIETVGGKILKVDLLRVTSSEYVFLDQDIVVLVLQKEKVVSLRRTSVQRPNSILDLSKIYAWISRLLSKDHPKMGDH